MLYKRLAPALLAAAALYAFAVLSGAAAGADGGLSVDAAVGGRTPDTAHWRPDAADAGVAGNPDGGQAGQETRDKRFRRFGVGARIDGGIMRAPRRRRRPFAFPPAPAGPAAPATTDAPLVPSGPAPSSPPSDLPFNTCQKIPPGKRVVKMNLKPEAELTTVLAWISSITCKSFVLPSHIGAAGKKITVVAPNLMTREEAYAAFLNALDAIGLAVERSEGFMKIIETAKAKSALGARLRLRRQTDPLIPL